RPLGCEPGQVISLRSVPKGCLGRSLTGAQPLCASVPCRSHQPTPLDQRGVRMIGPTASSTSPTVIASSAGSGCGACGSPPDSVPCHSTRCAGEGGGPQRAGGVGPNSSTDGVP